jgi:AraC-like DNA-binding protein
VSAYVEIAPPPALRPFVECLWVHRLVDPPPGGRRLLPSGRADFVWVGELGVYVSGPQTRYSHAMALPPMVIYGARFRPGAAPYLLRTPASELVDSSIPLDAIDARLARRLEDRIGDAREDATAALSAFGAELERRLRTTEPPSPAVREAIRLLDGSATVAEAAARAFVSERALQRRFARDVGYGPKVLQRVLRFQRFLRELAAPQTSLARAGLLAGYADQSHLTRETRRLAGLSPAQLTSYRH